MVVNHRLLDCAVSPWRPGDKQRGISSDEMACRASGYQARRTPDVVWPSYVWVRSGLKSGCGCLGIYQVSIFLAVGFEFHFVFVDCELDAGVHRD